MINILRGLLLVVVIFFGCADFCFAQRGGGHRSGSGSYSGHLNGYSFTPGFRQNENGSYSVKYGPSSFYYLPGYQPNPWSNSAIYPGMVNTNQNNYYYYYDMYSNTYRYGR